MKRILQSYLVDGILLILLGAVLLVYPQGTLSFVIRWVGILLLAMGGIKVLLYLFRKEDRSTGSLIVSILQIAAGVVMLAAPEFVKSIVPFVAGIFIAYGAIVSLVRAMKVRKLNIPTFKPTLCLSIITLILALGTGIFMITHPAEVSGMVVRLIGFSTLLEGVTMIVAASLKES